MLLTTDGYLFDGHQRLKAMLAIGRKRIGAKDVRMESGVTRENMLGYAYASNLVRRMTSGPDKAARMHQCAAMGWSQRRIAKEFHMSQPGVSQLMNAYPATGDTPEVIVTTGEDGKTYTRVPRGAVPKAKPWAYGGENFKALHRAHKAIVLKPPVGLSEGEKADLTDELGHLRDAIDALLDKLESM